MYTLHVQNIYQPYIILKSYSVCDSFNNFEKLLISYYKGAKINANNSFSRYEQFNNQF